MSEPVTPTPGPWSVETDPRALNALVYGKGRKRGQRKQLVAQVWSGDDCSLEVAEKNAHLLSAALDMREALKDALNSLRDLMEGVVAPNLIERHPVIVAGVAALKKAEGPAPTRD